MCCAAAVNFTLHCLYLQQHCCTATLLDCIPDCISDHAFLPSCCLCRFVLTRYKHFLGLNNPNDFMAAAAEMKRKGDFTSLASDAAAINAIRAEGMPADKVLGLGDAAEADVAAR